MAPPLLRGLAGGAEPGGALVSTRKISDQLGHSNVSMTQDKYLGRRLTDRQTAEVLEGLLGERPKTKSVPKVSLKEAKWRAYRRQNPGDLG